MQNSSTSHIVAGLSHAFRQELDKCKGSRLNTAGSPAYAAQVEFMYALDAVMRGSTPEVETGIHEAKRVIADLRRTNNAA